MLLFPRYCKVSLMEITIKKQQLMLLPAVLSIPYRCQLLFHLLYLLSSSLLMIWGKLWKLNEVFGNLARTGAPTEALGD